MIVVSVAGPLIFLAKLKRLGLIHSLLGGKVVMLHCVVDEVLGAAGNLHFEQQHLREFLDTVEIANFSETTHQSGRLNASDACTLTYAVNHRAD